MTEDEVLLQLGPPQIEVTVAKPQFFCGELFSLSPRDWDRGSFCGPDQSHGTRRATSISPVASSGFRISTGRSATSPDDDYDALLAKASSFLDLCGRSPLRVERYLNDAGSIAEIEKDNSAQIS